MSSKTFDAFKKIISTVDTKYMNEWKYQPTSFTRKRKLPPEVLILQILANKGKSCKMELNDFYQNYKLNGDVSVWGYEKRRLEFNPLMIHEMNQDFLKELYSDTNNMQKIKNYLLFAVDGSDIRIPATEKNYEKYGREVRKTVNSDNEPCMASISCIYDCLNKHILDCQINKYKFSERAAAMDNIDKATAITSEKAIYVFDRGYASFDLMYKLRNDKYVFRLQSKHFLAEQKQMQSDDEIFEDIFNKGRRKERYAVDREKYEKMSTIPINVRFIKIHLQNGQTEYLATNLDIKEFSTADIGEIYRLRWNIESAYRTMKSQMKLEEFSGYLSNIIEQDIYSCVFMYNLIISTINENYLSKDPERYKHSMKVNQSYSIGIVKTLFVKILLASEEQLRDRYIQELKNGINKYCVPVRPNRSYARKRNIKNKCSMSYKNSY